MHKSFSFSTPSSILVISCLFGNIFSPCFKFMVIVFCFLKQSSYIFSYIFIYVESISSSSKLSSKFYKIICIEAFYPNRKNLNIKNIQLYKFSQSGNTVYPTLSSGKNITTNADAILCLAPSLSFLRETTIFYFKYFKLALPGLYFT